MARVLVPGGQLMIYVWAMEQKNRHFEKQDVLVPWNRALCSQLQSVREQPAHPGRGQPSPQPCTRGTRTPGLPERRDCRRSHSVGGGEPAAGAANCCAAISKAGDEGNGFYDALGKSFRSWFSSRSFDDSTLRQHLERRVRSTERWAAGAVATQPSPHASLHAARTQLLALPEPTCDEDVFVEASQKQPEWRSPPAPTKRLNGERREDVRRNGDGDFLRSSGWRGAGPPSADADGSPSADPRRVSTDSDPEHPISLREQQAAAFMRYYHVFREGELCELLREHVSELHILSSGNDHGNWCIVAEKRGEQP